MSKETGLRAFFSRRKKQSSNLREEHTTETEHGSNEAIGRKAGLGGASGIGVADAATAGSTSPRRRYVPRYAARDMALSMPVEQRPDVVAKAREAQRQDVCSNIGFMCDDSMRPGASGSRFTPPPSIHPNLQVSQQAAMDRNFYSRRNVPSLKSIRSGALPRSASTPTPLQQMVNVTDIDEMDSSLSQQRPPRRPSAAAMPVSGRAQTSPFSSEPILPDDDKMSVGKYSTKAPTPRDFAVPAPRHPRQYFSHQHSLPNLRSKGKERAHGPSGKSSSGRSPMASPQALYEARDEYVSRTQPHHQPSTSADALPPRLSSGAPSQDESVTDSSDSRYLSGTSYVDGSSTATESLRTNITEHTEDTMIARAEGEDTDELQQAGSKEVRCSRGLAGSESEIIA